MDGEDEELAQRVALVSGGTRGLGRAIAQRLLGEGWRVFVCARNPADPVTAPDGAAASFIAADLRDPGAIAGLVDTVLGDAGRIDLLVNNAGGSPAVTVADSSPSLIQKVLALNLTGPLLLAQAAGPALHAAGGSVVNIASISGTRPAPGTVAYGAAKAGLINATRGLAMEWAPHVRVNAIVVGLVDNADQAEHYGGAAGVARIARTVPMGRLARGEDIAACVSWLASDTAAYVTGAAIELHGGGEIPAFLSLAGETGGA
ncbi:SDR family oxidoreductase [Sphingomonas sp.]|uniref:SDR family oxidoreductase n=1 Tax=Sphingomonas sp. TaxID=28214 RepID=UPI001EB1D894|nr:SDR family oxidoreductase [Sphingomonas sp.]MBX3594726.1 SDR family oxidoreductase [Sphingomonas sp.]